MRLSRPLALAAILCLPTLSFGQNDAKKPALAPPNPAGQPAEKPALPKVDMNEVSYAFGVDFGEFMKRNEVELDLDVFMQAIKDIKGGKEPKYNKQQRQTAMMNFQQVMRAQGQEREAKQAEANKKAGQDFLAENAKKEGVVSMDSGVQYKVMKEGTGDKPTATDTVKAIYKGTLIDGTVFDDSRGQPRQFGLNRVIKGWTEAVTQMPVGSKWQLYIPSDLAYGSRRQGQDIGPNSALIFDIELVSIEKKAVAVTPPVAAPRPGQPIKKRPTVTATTPPISVPLPPKKKTDPNAPKKEVPAPKKPEPKKAD